MTTLRWLFALLVLVAGTSCISLSASQAAVSLKSNGLCRGNCSFDNTCKVNGGADCECSNNSCTTSY